MGKKKQLTPAEIESFQQAYNDPEMKTVSDLAVKLGLSEKSIYRRAKQLKAMGFHIVDRASNKPNPFHLKGEVKVQEPPLTFDERVEVRKLKDQISTLKSDLEEAEKRTLTSEVLKEMIHGVVEHDYKEPDWLTANKSSNTQGIPTLFISDVHFDEYVDPSQINMVNSYNRELATKRIQNTFNVGVDILMNRMANPKYDGIVLAFGGDNLSGNIHEELVESNEATILQSILALTDLYIYGIELYLKHFPWVFVPCVVGNHGRMHKKPRMKNKIFHNFEWLIYQNLARYFQNEERVKFLIPDGPDAQFKVYNKNFLLTHGDQFRGGNAIAGIFSPLMLGFHRKQKKQASINKSFDVMMVGHFHQYVHTESLVINGSIKGYDEFANEMNFPFEPPQQALWINHPQQGMVLRTPILCDSFKEKEKITGGKITIFK